MKTLCIYAYPAQLIKIQLVVDDSITAEEHCAFNTATKAITEYAVNENIEKIIVIGHKLFAEKIANTIDQQFNIPVERLYEND